MSSLQKNHDVDLEAANNSAASLGPFATELKENESCISKEMIVCNVVVMDLETKECFATTDKDCRICHLSLGNQESGVPIELGCSCKDDLAAAHKHCAEAWFKIKGNRTCEICGSIAQNIAGVPQAELADPWSEESDAPTVVGARAPPSETTNCWKSHRFLNFLLACVVFAFVLSWLFRFNVPY